MSGIVDWLPGAGHAARGRWGRAAVFAGGWLGFLAVLAGRGRAAVAALGIGPPPADAPPGAPAAAVFLLAAVVGLPLLSRLDCRRIRRARGGPAGGQAAVVARRFLRNRVASAGMVLVLALYCVAILAPLLAPHHPDVQVDIVRTRYLPPGAVHLDEGGRERVFPLGTDKFGRDLLSRMLYGARISLSIGFIAVGIAVTAGTLLGALAGYFGGRTDWIVMRAVDVLYAFPRIFLILTLIAIWSPRIWLIIAVLGATAWMGVARLVRGQILSLKEREFVQATRALGVPHARVILRHVLPNTLSPVIVAASLMIGDVILTEAALSFLGLGVQPPTASWGNIINQGRDDLLGAWWVATFPGLAIVVTVVSYNLVGDGLRDALDPRG
jgi:peptide/nickel transport system permease protein